MALPIGDPRQSGEEGPAGDQRKAGEDAPAGDPREGGQAKLGSSKSDDTSKTTKKSTSKGK